MDAAQIVDGYNFRQERRSAAELQEGDLLLEAIFQIQIPDETVEVVRVDAE